MAVRLPEELIPISRCQALQVHPLTTTLCVGAASQQVPKELIAISRGQVGEDGKLSKSPVFAIHGGTGRSLFGMSMAQFMNK